MEPKHMTTSELIEEGMRCEQDTLPHLLALLVDQLMGEIETLEEEYADLSKTTDREIANLENKLYQAETMLDEADYG